MASPLSIEDLPLELRREVLKYIGDSDTLRRLVHASPSYYHLYRVDHDEIWTNMTIRNFQNREITLLKEAVPCVQITTKDNERANIGLIYQVVGKAYRQMRSGAAVRLTIPECKVLLTVTDAVGWKLGKSSGSAIEDREVLLCSRACFDRFRGRYYKGVQHTFCLLDAFLDLNEEGFPSKVENGISPWFRELFPAGVKNYSTLNFGNDFGTGLTARWVEPNPYGRTLWTMALRPTQTYWYGARWQAGKYEAGRWQAW